MQLTTWTSLSSSSSLLGKMYFDPLLAVTSSIVLLEVGFGLLLLLGEGGNDSLYFMLFVWASSVMWISGSASSFLDCRENFLGNLPLEGAAEWVLPIKNKGW